jgi:hypothetical protein
LHCKIGRPGRATVIDPEALRQRVRARLSDQRALVQRLLKLRELLPGSLFARYATCGKEECACRTGAKHGPYFVLSTRSGGRGAFSYLERDRARDAKDLVARHREFQDGLKRLRRVNADLVTLLRRYQAALARRGRRQLGVASPQAQKTSV